MSYLKTILWWKRHRVTPDYAMTGWYKAFRIVDGNHLKKRLNTLEPRCARSLVYISTIFNVCTFTDDTLEENTIFHQDIPPMLQERIQLRLGRQITIKQLECYEPGMPTKCDPTNAVLNGRCSEANQCLNSTVIVHGNHSSSKKPSKQTWGLRGGILIGVTQFKRLCQGQDDKR
jgi:hypothetical protein